MWKISHQLAKTAQVWRFVIVDYETCRNIVLALNYVDLPLLSLNVYIYL